MKILLPWIIAFALTCLMSACGYLIGSFLFWLRKRRRAIEDEIKRVSDIQIIEPPPDRPEEFWERYEGLALATGAVVILVGICMLWFGEPLLFFGAIALPAIVFYAFRGLWRARVWLGQKLPHAVVWRYRSWQLRRMGRRRLHGHGVKAEP